MAFVEEQCIHRLRSLEREDAVHFWGAPDWVSFGGFEIEQGASPCLWEDFSRVCGHVSVVSIQPQHRALEDSVDPQGGDFRGLVIPEILSGFFWVW